MTTAKREECIVVKSRNSVPFALQQPFLLRQHHNYSNGLELQRSRLCKQHHYRWLSTYCNRSFHVMDHSIHVPVCTFICMLQSACWFTPKNSNYLETETLSSHSWFFTARSFAQTVAFHVFHIAPSIVIPAHRPFSFTPNTHKPHLQMARSAKVMFKHTANDRYTCPEIIYNLSRKWGRYCDSLPQAKVKADSDLALDCAIWYFVYPVMKASVTSKIKTFP